MVYSPGSISFGMVQIVVKMPSLVEEIDKVTTSVSSGENIASRSEGPHPGRGHSRPTPPAPCCSAPPQRGGTPPPHGPALWPRRDPRRRAGPTSRHRARTRRPAPSGSARSAAPASGSGSAIPRVPPARSLHRPVPVRAGGFSCEVAGE